MNRETHVNDEDLAAFVDGELDAEARRRIEVHLVGCDDCRAIVAAAGRFEVPPAPQAQRKILWLGGGLAAAAALVLTVVSQPKRTEPVSRTRDVEVVGPSGLGFARQAPPDDAVVRPDTLAFSWTPVGDEATYRLTISTAAGAIVWSERTTDTSLALPPSVAGRLEAGRDYYWQVEAVLPDLRSATTGPRRFTAIAP
jgi:hypothetical protein